MISFINKLCLPAKLTLLLALLLTGQAYAQAALPPLPALTSPATNQQLIGKFVWADLFSSNIESSRRFYEGLFGWKFRWVSRPPQPYGIFSVDGEDVAGLAFRDIENATVYARWVHYVSVADVAAAEVTVNAATGRTLLRSTVADRGEFAIFSFPSRALVGVMRSSSGDPEDFQVQQGAWLWRQLFVRDLEAVLPLLREVAGYEIESADAVIEVDRVLISDGYVRAGLKELAPDSTAAPTWLGFIRVEDVAASTVLATSLGGTIQFKDDDDKVAIITDPEGALIGLLQWDYAEEES